MKQKKHNSSNVFLWPPLSVSLLHSEPQPASPSPGGPIPPLARYLDCCEHWRQLRLWPFSNPSCTCPQSPLLLS